MTTDPAAPLSPRSRRRLILALCLFLLALFALLEFGTRVYLTRSKGYDGKHLYQFVFDPYKNILPAPNFVDTRGVQHNSVGFRRSTEVSLVKPPGTYRIFLMGASTAYGLGGLWTHIDPDHPVLKNSETIDAYLERLLADSLPAGTKVEVINAAITSSWTHHNLIYLNQTILKYQPDMVLFMDGFNDYYFYDDGHDQFASYSYGDPASVIMGEPTLFSLAYGNGWWLFRKSALVHLLARGASNVKLLLTSHPPRKPLDVDSTVAGQARVFARGAYKMEERCGLILQNEHIVPVYILQPMLILERDRKLTEVERRLLDFNVQSYLPNYEPYAIRAAAHVREEMAALAPRVGGTFIDLTGIYKTAPEQIYTDYAHLTPVGNAMAARHIAEGILPLIRQHLGAPKGAS